MTGVYKITSPTGKVYIGQAVNINRRLNSYRRGKCSGQPRVYNSIMKYGWEAHKVEVLQECNEVELNKAERYWQEYYNSVEQGLNLRYTQTDEKSGKLSEEHRAKLRKPKTTTEKMKGPKSAEHIAKVVAANKGKKRGTQKNPSRKKGVEHWHYGIKRPKQSLKVQKGDNPTAKKIEAYTVNGTYIGAYSSQVEAMFALGLKHTGGICACCKGRANSYVGYKFNYAK